MKNRAMILFLIFVSFLFADQTEDLRFAIGLYQDQNYQLAEKELENFIRKYPQSNYLNDANYLLGNIKLLQKDFKTAERIFSELQKSNINPAIEPNILLGLAQVKFFLEDHSAAEKLLIAFQKSYPENDELWKVFLFSARIALQRNDLEVAETFLNKAEKQKKNSSIYREKFALYLKKEDFERMRSIMEILLDSYPNEETYQKFAEFLQFCLKEKKFDEISQYESLIRNLDSKYLADIKTLFGIAQYNLQNYQKAEKSLQNIELEKAKYYLALSFYEMEEEKEAENILQKLKESADQEIAANALFYLAKMEENPSKAIAELMVFLEKSADHKFAPIAKYLIGYNHFLLDEHDSAVQFFDASENKLRDFTAEFEKMLFLRAEAYFLQKKYEQAEKGFQRYQQDFSAGAFIDEALFKLGLIFFQQNRYQDAKNNFQQLLQDYPQSTKKGMSHFYLAEIYLNKLELENAEQEYRNSMQGETDLPAVWERISYIKYRQEKYDEALRTLEKIPDEKIYNKNFLRGKIYFAQRNYQKAVDAFSFAAQSAETDEKKESALSQKAWSLYKMKRFDEASKIYSQLADKTGSTAEYIFKSASAAFSAEDYERAIKLFKRFLQNTSDESKKASAKLSIADGYYNLGNYQQAVKYYRDLISFEIDEKILNNSLNGLRWSAEQDEQVNFLVEITHLLQKTEERSLQRKLLETKINFEYKNEMFEQVIKSADQIIELDPDFTKIDDIILMKGNSLFKTNKVEEAARVFSKLAKDKPTAEVFLQWSQLLLQQNLIDEALKKMRKASMLSSRADIWLLLLEIELNEKSDFFQNDLNRYLEFAKGEDKELAELLLVQYKIEKNIADPEISQLLKELSQSGSKKVKAKAQFLLGWKLYLENNFDEAIPELLRVRYLYPEFTETLIQSEAYACLAYLKKGEIENAENIFESIKKDIPPDLKNEIKKLMKVEDANE